MNEKQTQQQHRQHFNLSESAKQMLEYLTAQRYPGKQRRQSQVVEDLIIETFSKEQATKSTISRQSVEIAEASSYTSSSSDRSDRRTNVRSMTGKRVFPAATRMKVVAESRSLYGEHATSTETATGRCSSCNHDVQEDWKYCIYCGEPLAHVCPQCGAPRLDVKGALFCFECGGFLE
jgi:hypothetical protein